MIQRVRNWLCSRVCPKPFDRTASRLVDSLIIEVEQLREANALLRERIEELEFWHRDE